MQAYATTLGDAYAGRPTPQLASQWLGTLLHIRDLNGLNNALKQTRTLIDSMLETESEDKATLRLLIDWNIAALHRRNMLNTPGSRPETEFHGLSNYHEVILHLLPCTDPALQVEGHLARFRLMRDLKRWAEDLEDNFMTSTLNEEDQEWLEAEQQATIPDAEAALEAYADAEAWEPMVSLKRELALHHLRTKQPNQGVLLLKELIEDCTLLPDYEPPMQAEVLAELGIVLAGYGKKDAATRYLTQALNIYRQAGEEWELQVAQTETALETLT